MNRTLSATVVAVIALSSLSGCFLLPQAPEPQPSHSDEAEAEDDGAVAIGDCWETNYADMAEWSVWEGDDPVDCDEKHQSYTYYVGELEADVDVAWEDGSISAELASAVSDECAPHRIDLGITAEAARVGGYFFVSPEEDWEDGDHGFRCDIAVSELDSDWNNPDLESLPDDISELVDDIADDADAYALCLIGDAYGPYESTEAYYADCSQSDYYWRYAGTVEMPSAPGDPYPAEEALYAFAETECSSLGIRGDETVLPYTPSPEGWDAGYREITCWFSTIEMPTESAPI